MKLEWNGFNYEHDMALIVLDSVSWKEYTEAETQNIHNHIDRQTYGYTPGSFTPASFMGFYVGHTPWSPELGRDSQVFGRPTWLPSEMKKNGYKTFGWASMPYLYSNYGFDMGFDFYEDMRRQNMLPDIANSATQVLEHNRDNNIFMMIDIGECHRPFDFGDTTTEWRKEDLLEYNYKEKELDEEYLEYLRQRQIESIEYIDNELEGLLKALDERNAFTMITADHGSCFGEGNLQGHGLKFHEKQFKVPLGFRIP